MLYITPADGKLNRSSMALGSIRASNKALADAYAGVVRGKPNLLAYYRLGDATAATIKDSSGTGRDISGNTGGATNPVPGSSSLLSTVTDDGAMSFTPNQNKEQAFSGLPSAAQAWSGVCWCKPAAFGSPFSFAFSYGGGGGGTNDGFGLGFTSAGVPRFGLHNNGISVGAATAGHIYMLGLTYDGVTAVAYLGDVTAGTITTGSLAVTMLIGTGQPIFVGNFIDGTDFFSGIIDECSLWATTLSSSDMSQLFSYR